MTGLEMSAELITAREEALFNPIRRHEADGFVEAQTVPDTLQKVRRVSVLTEAQGLVHGDRNDQYGAPAEEYARTVGMVNAMLGAKLREPLTPEDLAYIMVCLKLSRQINKPKRDSLVDAAGYCEVAQWIIDARKP